MADIVFYPSMAVALLGFAAFMTPFDRAGKAMCWVGFVGLVWCAWPQEATTSIASIQKSPGGHYRVDIEGNGATINALLDTGASRLSLTKGDAEAIGIDIGGVAFSRPVVTAGGTARVAPIVIDELVIAGTVLRNVKAYILPDTAVQSLVGMNVIDRLGLVRVGD